MKPNRYFVSKKTAKFVDCHKMLNEVYEQFHKAVEECNTEEFDKCFEALDKVVLNAMSANIVELVADKNAPKMVI